MSDAEVAAAKAALYFDKGFSPENGMQAGFYKGQYCIGVNNLAWCVSMKEGICSPSVLSYYPGLQNHPTFQEFIDGKTDNYIKVVSKIKYLFKNVSLGAVRNMNFKEEFKLRGLTIDAMPRAAIGEYITNSNSGEAILLLSEGEKEPVTCVYDEDGKESCSQYRIVAARYGVTLDRMRAALDIFLKNEACKGKLAF